MIALTRPHDGPITQPHGNTQPDGHPHAGQDYGYTGTDGRPCPNVYAAAAGTVLYAGDSRALGWPNPWHFNPDFDRGDRVDSSAGNVLVIGHPFGVTTYSHLESWAVRKGDPVTAGQRIAVTGATGRSTGKHLHFELIPYPFNFGTATYGRADPNPYLPGGGLAAAGMLTMEDEEDGMADVSAVQAEAIAQRAAALVVEALNGKVLINPVQAESIVQATTARTTDAVDARNTGKLIDRGQADDIARAAARYTEEEAGK